MNLTDIFIKKGNFELRVSNVEISPGVTVIEGPSGSGKTTFLNYLAGLISDSSGKTQDSLRTSYVPQSCCLLPFLTCRENVEVAGMWDKTPPRSHEVNQVLARLKLLPVAELPLASLSGGEATRCAIARSALEMPQLWLLDEPFADLDRRTGETAAQFIKDLTTRRGIFTVIVSHDEYVRDYCDHLLTAREFEENGTRVGVFEQSSQKYSKDGVNYES